MTCGPYHRHFHLSGVKSSQACPGDASTTLPSKRDMSTGWEAETSGFSNSDEEGNDNHITKSADCPIILHQACAEHLVCLQCL